MLNLYDIHDDDVFLFIFAVWPILRMVVLVEGGHTKGGACMQELPLEIAIKYLKCRHFF